MNERRWSIADLQRKGASVALDANVLIYLTEADEDRGPHARAVLDAIASSLIGGSLATVGQVEVLAGSARGGDATVFESTAEAIRSSGLVLVPLSEELAEDAAWIRGQGGLGLADAIHVASARALGATAFVTNDRRIRPRAELDVLYLDDRALEDEVT